MRLRFPKMMSRSFQPRNVALRSNVRHAFRGESVRFLRFRPRLDPCRRSPSELPMRRSRPRNHPSIPAEIPHRARGAVGRSDCVPASIRPSELPMRRSLPRNHPSIRPVGRYRARFDASEKPSVDPCRNPPQGARRRRSIRLRPSFDPSLRTADAPIPAEKPSVDPSRRSIQVTSMRGAVPVPYSRRSPFRECRCAHACRPRMRLRFPKMMSRSFQPRNVALRSNVRHAFRGNPSDSFDSVPDSIPAVDPPPNCRCADPSEKPSVDPCRNPPQGARRRRSIRLRPSFDPSLRTADASITSEKPSVDPSRRSIQGALRCVRETIRRSLPKSPTRARGAVGRSDCVPASIRPSELPMRRSLPRNHPSIRPVGRYRSHRCAARFPSRIHVDPLPRMPMRPCLPSENAPSLPQDDV